MFAGLLMVIGFLFVGCGEPNTFCYFVSDDEIVLMTNSNLSTTTLKIQSNTQYDVTWDDDIISYDAKTGLITAKSEGKTKLTVSFTKNNKTQTKSVTVVVKEPVFATNIELEEKYIFFLGDTNNKINCKVSTQSEKEYNMGIVCTSSNPYIFQADKDNIIPQTVGEAKVCAKAISKYNQAKNEFEPISADAKVIILPQVEELFISLCDKNRQELVGETLNLFRGICDGVQNFYYLKVSSNVDMNHFDIKKASDDELWEFCESEQSPKIVENNKTMFLPIRALGSGRSSIRVKLERQNNDSVFVSNSKSINVFSYLSDESIKLFSTKTYKTKSQLYDTNDENLIALTQNLQTGKYELYKINDNSNYFDLAIQNKKYFYGLICFDNLYINCYNEINAEASEDGNLELEMLESNKFYVKAKKSGTSSITIRAVAIDGNVFQKVISFNIQNVDASNNYDYCETETNIVMYVGDEKELINHESINPIYANVEAFVSLQNNNGVLEIEEAAAKVVAKGTGTEVVILRIGTEEFRYNIEVREHSDVTLSIIDKQHDGESYCVVIKIAGNFVSIKSVVAEGNSNISYPNFVFDKIIISSSDEFTCLRITFDVGEDEDIEKTIIVDWE